METTILKDPAISLKTEPLCPVFGTCGGCAYQDIPYEAELALKQVQLQRLLGEKLGLAPLSFDPIVPSPDPYHYRHRLDLTLKKHREGIAIGFQLHSQRKLISVDECAIARKEVSGFIPELKELAVAKLPPDYRTANLVVRTGDDGRVFWGGIGRRSLELKPEDFLWTEIRGKRIYYSLDTFFQANLSILPGLIATIEELAQLSPQTRFFDLYSGVGLFGISFASQVEKVFMIEDYPASTRVAAHNVAFHGLSNTEIRAGKVEAELPLLFEMLESGDNVGIVDPPRQGLSASALEGLAAAKNFRALFYLSCHPESLARDLAVFIQKGWRVEKIVPFDLFPKTLHLETLALLRPEKIHAA